VVQYGLIIDKVSKIGEIIIRHHERERGNHKGVSGNNVRLIEDTKGVMGINRRSYGHLSTLPHEHKILRKY